MFADLAKTNVDNDKRISDLQRRLKFTIENVSEAVKDSHRIEKEIKNDMEVTNIENKGKFDMIKINDDSFRK